MNNSLDGHRARKRFGQNFLNDQQVIDNIVAAIRPQDGEALVEIGPGLAALTLPVAESIQKLHVVELDRDLADRLESHPTIGDRVIVHRSDALKFNFIELSEQLGQPLRVFGNLPYNISTPLIFHLLNSAEHIQDMHFMLQKEVVDRMAAGPGSKTFGRLSVMVQQRCKVEPVLHVPPHAFTPAPKVDSAVVRLTPYANPPYPVENLATLNHVCHTAFHQRRKTLRNNLKKLMSEEQIIELGLSPSARPETLAVSDFVKIANWVEQQS
ncbi:MULTISPECIES: 16S rRNA (adenine(1518)-N(6)/adenine(1519)-N(6))-dimethyltransferase RsmA [Gammaproteobacteria]|uniref:16S rRNA (adenine(1518)-N(6)/adenine(1519)-N(6))- dimethyltransferase RsmA n=1 Tax=Gammaproteobacteria TaxID=1236 RepID=UPI000DD0B363|nr:MULTISPECIES: 16S rRNA (adenine(1518)-N(6)/adenine(1519)-N(6))-dimethyltransferase RsmA [Gammaproteobacteria]RTE85624.1 16S rRNA (adenine(1518)-N(6)/adenine(1519)-N(6))-dimethyltransferase RsmA [Aliidiomarina sp. B3213]TCZ89593.1 16S rRNA (adenine(1518)-N(6)/adenine(1519)-N(6))-dimethyltransferase RsmA [Lysobacter sp. N42]